jgi:hypothetical protein
VDPKRTICTLFSTWLSPSNRLQYSPPSLNDSRSSFKAPRRLSSQFVKSFVHVSSKHKPHPWRGWKVRATSHTQDWRPVTIVMWKLSSLVKRRRPSEFISHYEVKAWRPTEKLYCKFYSFPKLFWTWNWSFNVCVYILETNHSMGKIMQKPMGCEESMKW